MTDPIVITHKGRTHTLREWAKITGLPFARLYVRYRAGWTTERLFAAHPAAHVTHNGQSLTYRQWADRTGIPQSVLRHRVANQWPLDRALTEPVNRFVPGGQPTAHHPGVANDFPELEGTGAGSLAQDLPKLEISE